MNKLIYIFLLTSFMFAQQDEIVFHDGRIIKGELDKKSVIDTTNKSIRFKPFYSNNYGFFNTDFIKYIRLSDGTIIDFSVPNVSVKDSQIFTDEKVQLEPSTNFEIKKGKLGGLLIAIGAGVLMKEIDNDECDNCDFEEFERFYEDKKSSQKLAYGFIMLGGILLLIGI